MELIIDCETLSDNELNAAVIDFSWNFFERERFIENPYTFEELLSLTFYRKLNVKEQVKNYKYKIKKETVDWWEEQSKEARKRIIPSEDDISLSQFSYDFFQSKRAKYITRWWSRGVFDATILSRISRDTGYFDELPPFYKVRDVRTYLDTEKGFTKSTLNFIPVKNEEMWKEKFVEHNSVHDVCADILRMQTITRIKENLELPE